MRRSGLGGAAFAGVVAAAVALGVAEAVAAFVRPEATPFVTISGAVTDRAPEGPREWAIRTFGTDDKAFLLTVIAVLLALFAAGLGMLARRRLGYGIAGVVVLGGFAVWTAVDRPAFEGGDVLPAIVGTVFGIGALVLLTRPDLIDRRPLARPLPGASEADVTEPVADPSRRNVLLVGAAALAAVAGFGGRMLQHARFNAEKSRAAVADLPRPVSPAAPAGPGFVEPGLAPYLTPNAGFYRIDTAFAVPQIRAEDWALRIHGLVDREIRLDYRELRARFAIERDITLACVSNEVGDDLIGNARWLGTPLADLLREAGLRPGADQIVSKSTDGMTIGTPVREVMDGRDAMLAYAMNGEPLPIKHGFPVRMVVPGLYGYVSACKWIVDIEVTTFDAFDAYWVKLGWAQQAPIKTQSRIDTPQDGKDPKAGRIPVAGVAWAQHRGITAVEVQVDEGPWQQAELAPQTTTDTWRQFRWMWDATPGRHTLRVRATDGTGEVQTAKRADVVPDGATGHHRITVTVR
ncbi:molybdopterin-dependent oxidoreductase [Embleya sp. NBC_00896]|uniref:molybdopterin-dependent oxidoreductase n=1 Tax=Embleya sp. NBC_00896 TaxID=2975961 RepID=UPI0038654CF8|nr:molybdopterin-dependent oxidoreductase [Embleya sp. NBC_00896]